MENNKPDTPEPRVRIVGDHPWKGFTGTLMAVKTPSVGCPPPMGVIRLDRGQNCPCDHECMADSKNLVRIN